jgi:hypothetical protein
VGRQAGLMPKEFYGSTIGAYASGPLIGQPFKSESFNGNVIRVEEEERLIWLSRMYLNPENVTALLQVEYKEENYLILAPGLERIEKEGQEKNLIFYEVKFNVPITIKKVFMLYNGRIAREYDNYCILKKRYTLHLNLKIGP